MAVPAASDAHIRRDGDALVFAGALDRAAAAALWAEAAAQLPGVQRFVMTNVTTVDSKVLALLPELAARARAAGAVPRVAGQPAGLADLQAAYRLTPELDFPA